MKLCNTKCNSAFHQKWFFFPLHHVHATIPHQLPPTFSSLPFRLEAFITCSILLFYSLNANWRHYFRGKVLSSSSSSSCFLLLTSSSAPVLLLASCCSAKAKSSESIFMAKSFDIQVSLASWYSMRSLKIVLRSRIGFLVSVIYDCYEITMETPRNHVRG